MNTKKKLIKVHNSYLMVLPKVLVKDWMKTGFELKVVSLSDSEVTIKMVKANGANGEYNKCDKTSGIDTQKSGDTCGTIKIN